MSALRAWLAAHLGWMVAFAVGAGVFLRELVARRSVRANPEGPRVTREDIKAAEDALAKSPPTAARANAALEEWEDG